MSDIAKTTCPVCNREIYISKPELTVDDITWGFLDSHIVVQNVDIRAR